MVHNGYTENDLKEIVDNPSEKEINFNQIDELEISTKDLYRCLLKGSFKGTHKLPHCNIVLSRVESFKTRHADFGYIDFKDSFIIESEFANTSFDYGAIINCRFTASVFDASHFKNVSITGTKFFDTIFKNCNLSNMVIESCEFHNCRFINCVTSNKLIELSFLYNCTFEKTNIQIETITHNFGIEIGSMIDSKIRDDLKTADYKIIEVDRLNQEYNKNNLSSEIEKFRINFFFESTILVDGSPNLDDTFKIENWIKLCQIPVTLINLLDLYYTFIIKFYEQNRAIFLLILKFHDLTNRLCNEFENEPEIYQKVIGIHMALSRYIEPFLLLTIKTTEALDQPLALLVEGPLKKEFYLKKLDHVFSNNNIAILKIKKHNSPNELFIGWSQYQDVIPLVALFFATRIKVELSTLSAAEAPFKEIDSKNIEAQDEPGASSESKQLKKLSFEIGPDQDKKELFGLRLKTIFPGNLLFDIGLHLNTKLLSNSRKIILSILTKDELGKPG